MIWKVTHIDQVLVLFKDANSDCQRLLVFGKLQVVSDVVDHDLGQGVRRIFECSRSYARKRDRCPAVHSKSVHTLLHYSFHGLLNAKNCSTRLLVWSSLESRSWRSYVFSMHDVGVSCAVDVEDKSDLAQVSSTGDGYISGLNSIWMSSFELLLNSLTSNFQKLLGDHSSIQVQLGSGRVNQNVRLDTQEHYKNPESGHWRMKNRDRAYTLVRVISPISRKIDEVPTLISLITRFSVEVDDEAVNWTVGPFFSSRLYSMWARVSSWRKYQVLSCHGN